MRKLRVSINFTCSIFGRDAHALGPVIRVFKRRYPLDANPKMEDVVNDEVCFYAHSMLRWGVDLGVWNKVGTSKELGLDGLQTVWFGFAQDTYWDNEIRNLIPCHPSENLLIWQVNQKPIRICRLKEDQHYYIEYGAVMPAICIVERFQYGHYLGTNTIYYHVKRMPWDDVDTYTKYEDKDSGNIAYFHFLGQKAVEMVIVTPAGEKYRFDKEHPFAEKYKLYDGDFGDIYWEYYNFITPEEFAEVWK